MIAKLPPESISEEALFALLSNLPDLPTRELLAQSARIRAFACEDLKRLTGRSYLSLTSSPLFAAAGVVKCSGSRTKRSSSSFHPRYRAKQNSSGDVNLALIRGELQKTLVEAYRAFHAGDGEKMFKQLGTAIHSVQDSYHGAWILRDQTNPSDPHARVPRSQNKGAPALSCSSHDCPHGKHAFRPKDKDADPDGCLGCDDAHFDHQRLYRLDLRDAAFTCQELRKELIREEFWTRQLNQHAINYALRKGRVELLAGTEAKIVKHVGPIPNEYEWNRVPIQDDRLSNPYQYAYHATGTCCRRCMRYLHGIPRDRELNRSEVTYFAGLVNRYLCERLPNLPDAGQHIPPIKNDP